MDEATPAALAASEETELRRQAIIAKLERGETLTRSEELFKAYEINGFACASCGTHKRLPRKRGGVVVVTRKASA